MPKENNKRDRFLAGRKRGIKAFRRIHHLNPANLDAVHEKQNPWPVAFVEIPDLDAFLFSDKELELQYELRDLNSSWSYCSDEYMAKEIGRYSNTRHPCSCYSCGNPRRQYKGSRKKQLTLQELIQDEKDKCEW